MIVNGPRRSIAISLIFKVYHEWLVHAPSNATVGNTSKHSHQSDKKIAWKNAAHVQSSARSWFIIPFWVQRKLSQGRAQKKKSRPRAAIVRFCKIPLLICIGTIGRLQTGLKTHILLLTIDLIAIFYSNYGHKSTIVCVMIMRDLWDEEILYFSQFCIFFGWSLSVGDFLWHSRSLQW